MNDSAKARELSKVAVLSDKQALADYVQEMLAADLRSNLSRVRAPILCLAATNSYMKELSDEQIRSFYANIFAEASEASIVLVHDARHFIEVDQPEVVGVAIETLLDGLAAH